jgi:F-type H+/Na+-transporting ATPase subunit alpha
MAAYIPTNLISITDGQIYLSPELFRKGLLPPVDVGKSVSRVGGKAQLPAYRAVAGDLRLTYSQFEELEAFSRFGTRLDEETRRLLARGRRVRGILRQPQFSPRSAAEQVLVLHAVNSGVFDVVPEDNLADAEQAVCDALAEVPGTAEKILAGNKLTDEDLAGLRQAAEHAVTPWEDNKEKDDAGPAGSATPDQKRR